MEKFEFKGSQGYALAARLDKPEGDIKYYALFAHCFTCTKDIFAAAKDIPNSKPLQHWARRLIPPMSLPFEPKDILRNITQ